MGYLEHKELSPRQIDFVVLTISDTRTEATDESGRLIVSRLESFLGREDVGAVITTGGTGISRGDITVETVNWLIEKKIDGFGELFRLLAYQEIGSGSIMSRALAGVAKGKVIICLPGSVDAVKLAVDRIILPEIGHLTREAMR